jgi:hypothetical protein
MKKIIIGITIATCFIILSSCNKNEESAKTTNNNISMEETINNFNNVLKKASSSIKNNPQKDIIVSNENNPYDNNGALHNNILEYLDENNYLSGELPQLIEAITEETNIVFTEDPEFYIDLIDTLNSLIYNENGSYNEAFVNSAIIGIPNIEKSTLNNFFDYISSIDDLNERIIVSKAAEDFVLESDEYNADTKKRLLTSFAIFRYSTFFWNDKYSETYVSMRQCDFIDAFGEFIAQNVEFPVGVIEDGSDVYRYAALFSAITGNVLGYCR